MDLASQFLSSIKTDFNITAAPKEEESIKAQVQETPINTITAAAPSLGFESNFGNFDEEQKQGGASSEDGDGGWADFSGGPNPISSRTAEPNTL